MISAYLFAATWQHANSIDEVLKNLNLDSSKRNYIYARANQLRRAGINLKRMPRKRTIDIKDLNNKLASIPIESDNTWRDYKCKTCGIRFQSKIPDYYCSDCCKKINQAQS